MTPETREAALRKQVLPGVYHGRAEGAKRTKAILLRLTPEEHAVLAAKARAAGLSINELLRQVVRQSRIYNHRGQERWYAVLLSLRAHLTALSDKAAGYEPANAAILLAYVAAIARHLEGVTHHAREDAHQIFPSRDVE